MRLDGRAEPPVAGVEGDDRVGPVAHGGEDTAGMPRADRVLDRIRATPPGFVRAYGDVSPGAPRFAGTVLAECDDPSVPWHRSCADGSLAKGARQRALLEAEGVPFGGERVDIRGSGAAAVVGCAPWVQREITLRPRPRGFHLVTTRCEWRCRSCASSRSASRTCSSATPRRR